MTFKRIACVLALLGGMVPMAAEAQPVVREANAPGAASKGTSAEARRRSQDTPFAFRGIALGITLDEFRAGSTVRATPLGSVPVCETDVLAGALGMRLKSRESLTVACRWAHRRTMAGRCRKPLLTACRPRSMCCALRVSTLRAHCVCTRFHL
jgi:hypothetical protein